MFLRVCRNKDRIRGLLRTLMAIFDSWLHWKRRLVCQITVEYQEVIRSRWLLSAEELLKHSFFVYIYACLTSILSQVASWNQKYPFIFHCLCFWKQRSKLKSKMTQANVLIFYLCLEQAEVLVICIRGHMVVSMSVGRAISVARGHLGRHGARWWNSLRPACHSKLLSVFCHGYK
jgi:hypothetical protein